MKRYTRHEDACLTRTFATKADFQAWATAWHDGHGSLRGFRNRYAPDGNANDQRPITSAQRKRLDSCDCDYYTDYGWNATDIPANGYPLEVDVWLRKEPTA